MAITLSLENLSVESFATASEEGHDLPANSAGPTLYGCTCGCGTQIDCPSQALNCTEGCIVPSGATDHIRCCG